MNKKFVELETRCGWSFEPTAQKAQEMANVDESQLVKFNFNGIDCFVSPSTDILLLFRDYQNANYLKRTAIGPDCVAILDAETVGRIDKAQKAADEKWKAFIEEENAKDAQARASAEAKMRGIKFAAKDGVEFAKEVEVQSGDPYSKCCVDYAVDWARLMQVEIANGKAVKDVMSECEPSYYGITGFMHGAAVGLLSRHWVHGEELRMAHNKEYNHDGEGVVNPAVFTIGKK